LDERLERARQVATDAVFTGSLDDLPDAERAVESIEADVALVRGRLLHARYLVERAEDPDELRLFERATATYRRLGDMRGEAEGLFWCAIVHQVIRADHATATPMLNRAREQASGDAMLLSYVLRHLGIAAHVAGEWDEARGLLEESTRLRRELDMPAGVAANLVGLAYVAQAQGRPDDAGALLDEARALAETSGAHAIVAMVDQAR
jgi:hypothetical protein